MKRIWFFSALLACFGNICIQRNIYTNSWAVHIRGTSEYIEKFGRKFRFLNLGKIFADGDYYYVRQKWVSKQSLQPHYFVNVRLKMDPKVIWFAQQAGKTRTKRHPVSQLNDPLFNEQWHLSDAFDQNVRAAWSLGYTGKGVVVSVIDDGIENSHPDLEDNYDPLASYDMNDNDPNPEPRYTKTNENSHGTRCAGEVAAVANNGVCGVGVAYQAKIGGIRMLDGHVIDLIEAKSLNFNQQHIDIYSASWGPDDDGKTVEGPSILATEAFIQGISRVRLSLRRLTYTYSCSGTIQDGEGRGGLGSIYIWASGNGGTNHDNCNFDGYVNSIYTLSVSSTTSKGTLPFYIEPCSAILTTTYSGGSLHDNTIVTTDLWHTCTSDHTGTSASAPLAAGIIALALEANPALTWRDVQHIVVRASRPADLKADDWKTNGVGRPVSHYYGYGLLDAGKMVGLARKWNTVQAQRKCIHDVLSGPLYEKNFNITAFGSIGCISSELHSNLTLKWNETACLRTRNWIRSLEHIQAVMTLSYTRRGDLSIVLTSPLGTQSILVTIRPFDTSLSGYSNWAFMSTHSWDEEPSGEWTLQIQNKGKLSNRGILSKFQLVLYGTKEHMIRRHMERTMVQQCAAWNPNGTCKECIYPFYIFENICLMSCPTHYYEWGNNNTHTARRCQRCHQSCRTCFDELETNCLACPPYSTLEPHLGTCSAPSYPWDRRGKIRASMVHSTVIFTIILGGPLLLIFIVWVVAWVLKRFIQPQMAAPNQASDSSESRDREMVTISSRPNEAEDTHFPSNVL